ncbi:MAG TPA: DUF2062 domain-containing protein [Thermoanaerobaculia bacterium]|nr:DUF2062 domain-containing protein [Thermoanaerobaculia bacterium]
MSEPSKREITEDTQERRQRAQRSARLARLRWWLRRLPRRATLHRYPVIRHFAAAARRRPYLWSFELPGVRRAIYTGAVISFLPVFGLQLFVAFLAAILVRANLAVTCGLQLLTNPLTIGPVYYTTYRIGIWIIRTLELGEGRTPMGTRFNALILGGLVVGLAVGVGLDLALRLAAWEARVLRDRHRRARDGARRQRDDASGGPRGAA